MHDSAANTISRQAHNKTNNAWYTTTSLIHHVRFATAPFEASTALQYRLGAQQPKPILDYYHYTDYYCDYFGQRRKCTKQNIFIKDCRCLLSLTPPPPSILMNMVQYAIPVNSYFYFSFIDKSIDRKTSPNTSLYSNWMEGNQLLMPLFFLLCQIPNRHTHVRHSSVHVLKSVYSVKNTPPYTWNYCFHSIYGKKSKWNMYK